MSQAILTAPYVQLDALNHLFIELTAANCNLRCKHCYLEFDPYKKIKDFISIDKLKRTLIETKSEPLKCIYLTGGEPMIHPHFNNILRMCLKRSNVTIFTNGIAINDKKARFLRKVEDETQNELIIKLSLDHFDEQENDKIRGRGNYRKVLFAVQSLIKYEFNPILSVVNVMNMNERELVHNFIETFAKAGVELEEINFAVVPLFSKDQPEPENMVTNVGSACLDCASSRILTNNGVYACPLMTRDQRGRSGCSFMDYSKKNYVETATCQKCVQHGKNLFINHWMK